MGDTRRRETLERHDAAATAVINGAGGRVIESLGDGVFARFGSVPEAVSAGRAFIEAARIAALAGPGELLVSDAAHGLLAGAQIGTTDTGFHALKGLDEPYRLWTVDATV